MEQVNFSEYVRAAHFGHRKLTPRACVIDSKKHLRLFLSDALEDLGFVTCECGHAGDLANLLADRATGPDRAQRMRRRHQCRRNSRSHRPQGLRRQGSCHRPTRLDHGESRPADRRRIRHCDAALAADAIRHREFARQRRRAVAGRAGAEPGRRCRRGAEGRLARIVVPAEDRHPLTGACGCGGAGADAASRLGRSAAGQLHSRRQGSAVSRFVRIRGRPRHRGLAPSAGEPGPG